MISGRFFTDLRTRILTGSLKEVYPVRNPSVTGFTKDMVKQIEKNNKALYQCEECGLFYADPETAQKCQAWCAEHKSCNLEIIKFAIKE